MLATAVVYFITASIGENFEVGSHEAKAAESGEVNLEGTPQHETGENSHVTGSHKAMETNQGNMTMIQQQHQQQKEAKEKSNSLPENSIGIAESSNESVKRSIEFPLFLTAGIAYGLVGFWMLKDKKNRVPYFIAALGSILLIGLYTASHMVGLPQIGLEHVGVLDLLVAALQVGIVGCSGYVILSTSEKRITRSAE